MSRDGWSGQNMARLGSAGTRSSISSTARLTCTSFCASRARSTTFVLGPCVWIEERIASDRDPRIGLADLAELHPDVAFARIRAHRFREHADANLELRRYLVEHRLHD